MVQRAHLCLRVSRGVCTDIPTGDYACVEVVLEGSPMTAMESPPTWQQLTEYRWMALAMAVASVTSWQAGCVSLRLICMHMCAVRKVLLFGVCASAYRQACDAMCGWQMWQLSFWLTYLHVGTASTCDMAHDVSVVCVRARVEQPVKWFVMLFRLTQPDSA